MPISRNKAWFIWGIASLFYAYQFVLRVMPSIMLTDIMRQFHIDTAVFGQFSGVYYLGYSLMHLPIGILLDRVGPKKVMTTCILLAVIGLLPILFTNYWVYPLLGRALIGIGSSAAILGTFKIIRLSFSTQRFTRMLSLSVTLGLIGAIYGGGPVAYLCTEYGYRFVVGLFALIGVLLAMITYLSIPAIGDVQESSLGRDLTCVLTNPRVLVLCILAGLMVGPMEGFADVWGASFLKQVYALDTPLANSLPSMIFIGMCFGAPLLSLIAEKSGYYLGTIIGAGGLMALIFVLLVTHVLSVKSISLCFVLVGICSSYQILAIYQASSYVPPQVIGLTTAVANMIIMSFGYFFHSTIGLIIHSYPKIDPALAFTYGISVIPITLTLATLGFLVLAYYE